MIGFFPKHGAQKLVEAHVRPLARAVDREVAERDGRHVVVDVVQITQLLGRQFGYAVRRHRLRQRVLAHGHRHQITVHRRAGRVHDALQRQSDAGLEEPLRGADVVHCIDVEVASPALADTRLGCQVEDMRAIGQKRAEVGTVWSWASTNRNRG